MATAFKIEKGLDAPTNHPSQKYPFPQMEVGDSFAAPSSLRGSLSNVAVYQGRKLGRKFAVRKDGDGVRVWRLA